MILTLNILQWIALGAILACVLPIAVLVVIDRIKQNRYTKKI